MFSLVVFPPKTIPLSLLFPPYTSFIFFFSPFSPFFTSFPLLFKKNISLLQEQGAGEQAAGPPRHTRPQAHQAVRGPDTQGTGATGPQFGLAETPACYIC